MTPNARKPNAALVQAAAVYSTATLHEAAGQRGALPSAIKPVHPAMRLSGPAVTIKSPPGDNLWIHRALAMARPGDVLVVDVQGRHDAGYWGEILSTAAVARELGGLVIDGSVRDGEKLAHIGFPVFARGLCVRGTGKDPGRRGEIGMPLTLGDANIHPDDLMVGDGDGVVALPREEIESILVRAKDRERKEAEILERLQCGETTLEIYGWK